MEMEHQQPANHHHHQVLKVLEALKQASHDLRSNPTTSSEEDDPASSPSAAAIKALFELETEADTILSVDPNLAALSRHLSSLKTLVRSLHSTRRRGGGGLLSFLSRRLSALEVSRLATAIESDIQAWIDREIVDELLSTLRRGSEEEEQKSKAIVRFKNRVSRGFDHEFQDLVLRSGVLASLENVLCDPCSPSKGVREQAAFAIASLILFNKDVFVGEVLMGPTVRFLISMASSSASLLEVLCLLIRTIRSPLVDEMESNREIGSIIAALGSADLQIRIAAMDCVLEIGYYGRKGAIEAVLREGLIERLMEMQESDLGGDLIDLAETAATEEEERALCVYVDLGKKKDRAMLMERRPFASCVARFAVQVEVGEGLRQREKRAFKQEILGKVREASIPDAKAATIVAEVLWGSSP